MIHNPISPIDFIYQGYDITKESLIEKLKVHLKQSQIDSLIDSSSPLDEFTCYTLSEVIGRSPDSWMNLSYMYFKYKNKFITP